MNRDYDLRIFRIDGSVDYGIVGTLVAGAFAASVVIERMQQAVATHAARAA